MDARYQLAAARASAAQIIALVVDRGRYLDAVLDELRSRQGDKISEFPLIQELAYGTLRWYHQLAGIAHLFVTRPFKQKDRDLHALLLIGLYQLRHMRVPGYAAVDTTVAATEVLKKSWAKGVLNAALRAYLRDTKRTEQAIAGSEELSYSHPTWLVHAIQRDYPNDWRRIFVANNDRPPMTLRVNTTRIARESYQDVLRSEGIAARAHALVDTALTLERPVPVDRLPGFQNGWVSIQDAGAQLAAAWLDTQPQQRVLDACAAPGGKAAHIAERTPALGELTALDIDEHRLERTRLNFARLGVRARLVLADAANPSQWWDGSPYERILLDAPCSATGVIRRHPDIKVRRRLEEVSMLVRNQARILAGVWPCLARGGKLLYATCSVLDEENELQVRGFVAAHSDAAVESLQPGPNIGRQILPGEGEMDGFYYACLRKV
jgi:16S rRNA (cytosine967-C5)-methyltransferase